MSEDNEIVPACTSVFFIFVSLGSASVMADARKKAET